MSNLVITFMFMCMLFNPADLGPINWEELNLPEDPKTEMEEEAITSNQDDDDDTDFEEEEVFRDESPKPIIHPDPSIGKPCMPEDPLPEDPLPEELFPADPHKPDLSEGEGGPSILVRETLEDGREHYYVKKGGEVVSEWICGEPLPEPNA